MKNIKFLILSLIFVNFFNLVSCGSGDRSKLSGEDIVSKPSLSALSECNLKQAISETELDAYTADQEISFQDLAPGTYYFEKIWVLWRQDQGQTYLHYVDEMVQNSLGGASLERTYDCGGGFPTGHFKVNVSMNGLYKIDILKSGSPDLYPRGVGFKYDSHRDIIGSIKKNGVPTKDPGFEFNESYDAGNQLAPLHKLNDIFPNEKVKIYRLSQYKFQIRTENYSSISKINAVMTFQIIPSTVNSF